MFEPERTSREAQLIAKELVPKKGLEPPRPCGHMDLNHARLPIPPLRRVMELNSQLAAEGKNYINILQGARMVSNSESLRPCRHQ